MKLMVTIFTLVMLVMVDQARYRGYYLDQVAWFVAQMIQ